jgi:hypothetical protein
MLKQIKYLFFREYFLYYFQGGPVLLDHTNLVKRFYKASYHRKCQLVILPPYGWNADKVWN